MRYLILLALICLAPAAEAYNPLITEIERPYDVVVLERGAVEQQDILGELDDYPVMYEITAGEPFLLSLQLRQPYKRTGEPAPLALIAVRENDLGRGITEVERLRPVVEDWQVERDSVLGMSFWVAPPLEVQVASGTYRFEISSTDNIGQYMITAGTQPSPVGYFSLLGSIYQTHTFFGYSSLRILTSSIVYYPLGILVVAGGLFWTWRNRKKISHVA